MGDLVNLADYRPKTEIRITGKLDSKKVCELLDMEQLLFVSAMVAPHILIDGDCIILDKDDIEAEISKRD